MELKDFNEAVKMHHRIKNLEGSLRALEERTPESIVQKDNSKECAAHVKAVMQTDLSTQLDTAKKDLATLLAN